ncbi:hypothetical protein DL96DRAFT_1620847, partial [Flagelloscypha sp. PMI_526]
MPSPLHLRAYYDNNYDNTPTIFPIWGGIVIAFVSIIIILTIISFRVRRARMRRFQADMAAMRYNSNSNNIYPHHPGGAPPPPPPYPGHGGYNPAKHSYPITTMPTPAYDPNYPNYGGGGWDHGGGHNGGGTGGGGYDSGGGFGSSGGGGGGDNSGGGG